MGGNRIWPRFYTYKYFVLVWCRADENCERTKIVTDRTTDGLGNGQGEYHKGAHTKVMKILYSYYMYEPVLLRIGPTTVLRMIELKLFPVPLRFRSGYGKL